MNPPEIRSALDTSVVMRLLTGQPLDLAKIARGYMAETEQAGAKVFVSNLVVLEAYFACQHHYGMAKDAVLTGLHELLSIPTFIASPIAPATYDRGSCLCQTRFPRPTDPRRGHHRPPAPCHFRESRFPPSAHPAPHAPWLLTRFLRQSGKEWRSSGR